MIPFKKMDYTLLTALVAAMSEKAKLTELDKFVIWRDAENVPLD